MKGKYITVIMSDGIYEILDVIIKSGSTVYLCRDKDTRKVREILPETIEQCEDGAGQIELTDDKLESKPFLQIDRYQIAYKGISGKYHTTASSDDIEELLKHHIQPSDSRKGKKAEWYILSNTNNFTSMKESKEICKWDWKEFKWIKIIP